MTRCSALLFAALTAMAEIPALYAQQPIVHRQQLAAFYHPFVEAAALTLVDIPITFFIMIAYCLIIYLMVGLQKSVVRYFLAITTRLQLIPLQEQFLSVCIIL